MSGKKVVIESPYSSATNNEHEIACNILFARMCMKFALINGYYPFASHLLYTQPLVLDDTIPEERETGINAGLSYVDSADETWVFIDFGVSKGMEYGVERAKSVGRKVRIFRLMEHITRVDWNHSSDVRGLKPLVLSLPEYDIADYLLVAKDFELAIDRINWYMNEGIIKKSPWRHV